MNMAIPPPADDLGQLALAAVAARFGEAGDFTPDMLPACLAALRRAPSPSDAPLLRLADALSLGDAELLTVALALAAERDATTARALAEAQAPLGSSRLLAGLAAEAFALLGGSVAGLACGAAVQCGLLTLGDEAAALPERSLWIAPPLVAALSGIAATCPGIRLAPPAPLPLPDSLMAEAGVRAALLAGRPGAGLVLRSASPPEAMAVAAAVAAALGRPLARVETPPPPGLAPWLIASAAVPVFACRPGPGERWPLPALAPHAGPWLAIAGPEGAVDTESEADEWALPVPGEAERLALWTAGGASPDAAARAAATFRQGAGRIAEVASRARLAAARESSDTAEWRHVTAALAGAAGTLDAHARRGGAHIPDDALVATPALRAQLAGLTDRARVRARLADGLGPAVTARYRPGVRALLVGPPGTGKSLAAHWLAGRLGLPLYRVDLAALTSKYIGETEKNLSALFAAAEHADVVLFFDEADALFAARTDVGSSNDRFANAQTNYLLQRIEEHDGICLLAANSRERFDPAFVRRLDAILDFPLPDAAARRELWAAHLGDGHDLEAGALDRLAVSVDLSGGHIRNVVLAAAARALADERGIAWPDLAEAAHAEYAKLGRAAPRLD